MLNASQDPARSEAWWTAWPEANVGIATGAVSGLVVLDVDEEAGGDAGLRELCGPDLPPAPRVRTGRGYHLYFRCPADVRVRNRVSLAPGVDVRGEGGYVVAPPSRHVSGATYAWERTPEEVPLPPLPPAVRARLGGPRPAPVVEERIPQGARNNTLTSLAGTMRRRGMSEEEILAALQAVNERRCDPPLAAEEVQRIAASVARYPPEPSPPPKGEASFENREDGLYFRKSKVANFQLYPYRVLLLEDGQQLVRAELRAGSETRYLDLPPEAFTDVRNFRAHIPLADAVWLSAKRDVLWRLQEWLSAEGVPRIHAATALGRWRNGKGDAFWVLPELVLGPEGPVEDPDVVFLDRHRVAAFLPIRYPTFQLEPAFAREVVDLLMNLNVPLVALGVLGWHMACPYAAELGQQGYKFPILNLWGTRGVGKTTTIEIYQRLCGYVRPVGLNVLTTPFARMVRLTVSNGIPVHLAELRWMSSGKLEQAVRDLILQYDGISEMRGRPDLSVLEFQRTSPIVVDGEEAVVEPAFQERAVQLALSLDATRPGSVYAAAAQRLRELPLERFAGPYVLWTLREPPPLEGAKEIVNRVPETRELAERVRRNLTVVVVGLLSLKHFLLRHGLEALPTEHVESWVRLYVQEAASQQRNHARIFLEYVVLMYMRGYLPYVRVEQREEETILWFPALLAYQEWRFESRRSGAPTVEWNALRRQLEEEVARGLVYLERRDVGNLRSLPMCGLRMEAAAAAGLYVPGLRA